MRDEAFRVSFFPFLAPSAAADRESFPLFLLKRLPFFLSTSSSSRQPPPLLHSPRSAQEPGQWPLPLLLLLPLPPLPLLWPLPLKMPLLPLLLLERTLHPSRHPAPSTSSKSSAKSGRTPNENWQLKSSKLGLIRSGNPISFSKNFCVGSLHELRQAETQFVEAR